MSNIMRNDAPPGALVKYIGASDAQVNWGSNDDPREVLKEGSVYTVDHTEIHSFHTKVYLRGVEGKFNSVSFKEVDISVDWDEIKECRLKEMPHYVLEKAVEVVRGVFTQEEIDQLNKDREDGKVWMIHLFDVFTPEEKLSQHCISGMGIRNLLRDNNLVDDLLPSGNWDDYYEQVVEIALGMREFPTTEAVLEG